MNYLKSFFLLFFLLVFVPLSAQNPKNTLFTDAFISEIPVLMPDQDHMFERNLSKTIGSEYQFSANSFTKRLDDKEARKLYRLFKKKKNHKGKTASLWKPHHFITYVNEGIVVQIVMICLECNKTKSYPSFYPLEQGGLTPEAHMDIRSILVKHHFIIP